MAGIQENSYDFQFYLRRSGAATAVGAGNKSNNKPRYMTKEEKVVKEIESRENKAKKWSSQNATLGHVAKTNVLRPRALLAQPVEAAAPTNLEQKQRASLWKARIYCDQAYQAFFQVLDGWRSGGAVAGASVQTHYAKLFKCLGISAINKIDAAEGERAAPPDADHQNSAQQFKVQPAPLSLLLKLEKGRILLARIFEQALLPPNSVVPLLPAALGVLLPQSNSSGIIVASDPSDDRCFIAMARIIQTLPNLTGEAILQCIKTTIAESSKSSQAALSTTSRMQCVHAILHRGGSLAAQGGDANFQREWSQAEAEFMKILSGM